MQNTNLHHKNYQPPIQRLARVIRDTLEVAENTIFIGRENLANQDFNAPVISIEQSGTSEVKGFEQQWKHTISLSAPTGVRDLHFATGSQYRERVMFSINASVADYINVSTASINHLSFQLSNEKGSQHEQ